MREALKQEMSGFKLSTELKSNPASQLSTGEGDNQLSHIVRNEDQLDAYINGNAITALCGKRWIPHRDPEIFPLCQECQDKFESIFGKKFI